MGHGLPLCNLAGDSALNEKLRSTGLNRFSDKICNAAWHRPKLTNLAYSVDGSMVIESYNILGEDYNRSELNRKARLNMLGFAQNDNNAPLYPGKMRINPTTLGDVHLWDVPRYQSICRKAVEKHVRAGRVTGLAEFATIPITDDLIRKYCSFESRTIFYEQNKTDATKFDNIDSISIHGQYFNIRVLSGSTYEGWPNASGLEPGILTDVPRYFSNSADSATKPYMSEGSSPEGWCNFTTRTIYQYDKSSYRDNVEIITNGKTLFFLPKGQNVYTKKSLKDIPRYKGLVVP